MAQSGPPSPSSASHRGGASGGSARAVQDPAALLRVRFDQTLKDLPPTHRAYRALQAVLAGDTTVAQLLTSSHETAWDTKMLVEPLGVLGQVRAASAAA